MPENRKYDRMLLFFSAALGIFAFAAFLEYHNIADGDLWARLAQGASIWIRGGLIHKDIFAFTPVLPEYIDHEWGTGLLFYTLLRLFGPESLLALKIAAAIGALAFATASGRSNRCGWPVLLLLALPCAAAIVSGFVLVVRSQVMTYLFFSMTLFCLEAVRRGHKWPSFVIIAVMTVWANTHAGFVSGLGIMAVYAAAAFIAKRTAKITIITTLAAIGVTFIDPYGVKLWRYVIPAVLHPRLYITEWHPMQMTFSNIDPYTGFRVLFIIAVIAVIAGWDKERWKERLPGFLTLSITLYLALKHRRHAPFFGLSAAAFLGPYLSSTIERVSSVIPRRMKIDPMVAVFSIYGVAALLISVSILPLVRFQVWSPVGFFPVRECDILMYSKAEGNLAVAFPWGNYAMWRLYPRVKISQCGRYETVYPESTVDMNRAFFYKTGDGWDRMIKEHRVDYVILELNITRLRPEDLKGIGFKEIYSDGFSALWARDALAPSLLSVSRNIRTMDTIQPLDASIPEKWWQ